MMLDCWISKWICIVVMLKPSSMYWMYSAAPSSLPLPSMSPVLWLRRIAACIVLQYWSTFLWWWWFCWWRPASLPSQRSPLLGADSQTHRTRATPHTSTLRHQHQRLRWRGQVILNVDNCGEFGIRETWNIPSSTSPPLIAVEVPGHLNLYNLASNQHPSSSLLAPAALFRINCESLKCTLSFYWILLCPTLAGSLYSQPRMITVMVVKMVDHDFNDGSDGCLILCQFSLSSISAQRFGRHS